MGTPRKPSRKRQVLIGGGTGALVLAAFLYLFEDHTAQRVLCGAARGACAELAPEGTYPRGAYPIAPVPKGLVSSDQIPASRGCPPGSFSLSTEGCWWRLSVRVPSCIEGVTWEGPDGWCYAPALPPPGKRPSVYRP